MTADSFPRPTLKRWVEKPVRRDFLRRSLALLGTSVTPTLFAQSAIYPAKPIRLVVAFAPGGGTDIISRHLAAKLGERLGQPMVVENRPGAGGTIGAESVVRAAADGYTINMATSSYAVNPGVYPIPYNPVADISPISTVAVSPFIVVVHPSMPVNNINDLISYARAQPDKVNYASTGLGGITHLGTELFKLMAHVQMQHIPYKGTGAAFTDAISGRIQVMWGSIASTLPYVKDGKLKALAVTTKARIPALPDIPTVSEAGVPGYELVLWYGIFGPAKMSGPVVDRLNTELRASLELPDIRKQLAIEGLEPQASSPDEFRDLIASDIEKYAKVVKAARISIS